MLSKLPPLLNTGHMISNNIVFVLIKECRWGEVGGWRDSSTLRNTYCSHRGPGSIPSILTEQLIIAGNTSSRRSDDLLARLQALYSHAHTPYT